MNSNSTLEEARAAALVALRKLGALIAAHDGKFTQPGSFDEYVLAESGVKTAALEYFKACEQAVMRTAEYVERCNALTRENSALKQKLADIAAGEHCIFADPDK